MRGLRPRIVGKVYPKASPVVSRTISPIPALLMSRLGTRTAVKPPTLAANVLSASSINLVATPATGFVVSRYQFQFSSDGGVNYVPLATQATATYLLTGLAEYTTYHFRVVMEDAQGNTSSASTAVSGRTLALAPVAPALSATAVSSSQINLAATGAQSAAGIASYTFQVATAAGGPWSALVTQSSPNYSHTGLPGSATRYYRVFVTDVQSSPLSSGNSNVASATTSAAATAKRWTTGQAIRADAQGYPSKDAQHYATYDQFNNVSNVVAVEIPVNWYRTNPSIGVYDFSYVTAHIQRATQNGTNPKKILLVTQYQNYGSSVPQAPYNADDATLPNFILSQGYGATRTSGGVMPKLDIPACADLWLDWITALCAYAESRPEVVLVTVGETSSAYTGMSSSGYANSWYRVPAVLKNAAPNVWCCIGNNGLTSPTTTIALTALMASNGIGLAVEDAVGFYGAEPSQYGGWGYYSWAGIGTYDDGDGNGPVNYGTTDLRLVLPMRAEQQVIRSTVISPAQANTIMNTHWKNSLSVWAVYFDANGNSYTPSFYGTSTPATAFSGANLKAFLSNAANAVTCTAYPSYVP